jgi:uncharacterized protein
LRSRLGEDDGRVPPEMADRVAVLRPGRDRRKAFKVLVAGPVGAGKTTLIKTIALSALLETDELATEDLGKATTTVAIDYGECQSSGRSVSLWGTPGQARFDFMWEIAAEGADGLLVVVSSRAPRLLGQAKEIRDAVLRLRPVPYRVVLTQLCPQAELTLVEVARSMGIAASEVSPCDATQAASVQHALDALVVRFGTSP